MNSHEATEDREAERPCRIAPEGSVSQGGGHPEKSGWPPLRYRLKRSVDCHLDGRDSLHLIRDGLEEQYAIDQPEARDLRVIELLQSGYLSEAEIAEQLRVEGHAPDTLAVSLRELDQIGVLEHDRGRELLTEEDRNRFDRQLVYLADLAAGRQSGWQLQVHLQHSRVAVLGCGGLGSWAATGLALAGVRELTLIDDDVVELSNLNRQVLFRSTDVGRTKVEVAADALTAIDPDLRVRAVPSRLCEVEDLVDVTSDVDFLVMTADEPPYELARRVNLACLETGTPWISAGQIPPLVRIGPTLVPGETACHGCQEASFLREYPDYEALVRHRAEDQSDAASLGAASGTIGSLIAMEVIHHLTRALEPATLGRAMIMDLRTFAVRFEPVERNPDCFCANDAVGADPFRASTVL